VFFHRLWVWGLVGFLGLWLVSSGLGCLFFRLGSGWVELFSALWFLFLGGSWVRVLSSASVIVVTAGGFSFRSRGGWEGGFRSLVACREVFRVSMFPV